MVMKSRFLGLRPDSDRFGYFWAPYSDGCNGRCASSGDWAGRMATAVSMTQTMSPSSWAGPAEASERANQTR
jgi:hypothetical protein